MRRGMWMVVVVVLGLIAPLQAGVIVSGTADVPGTAIIWGAGHTSSPDLEATLPPVVSFTPGSGLSVSFSSITGSVKFGGDSSPANGPDGQTYSNWPGTNINGYDGISGIQFNLHQMFLVGVFLGPLETSGSGPAKLVYTPDSANLLTFSPLLAQVFFIGDGLGAGFAQQTFNVPTGATRLFFGFADGVPNFGAPDAAAAPGAYGDNKGSLSVSYILDPPENVPTPEPSSLILMGLGIAALTLLRRRRA